MEEFTLYLLKSVVWLSAFTTIYFLFLRNERFFLLKRIYLISGIFASLLLPMITLHYYVELPPDINIQSAAPAVAAITDSGGVINLTMIIFAVYTFGAIVIALRVILHGMMVIGSIKSSEVVFSSPVKLVRTARFTTPFSFFSWVFVNPSVTDVEEREILNHEMVHIRQKHWADLILAELLCILQWFNPLTWLYVHFIRQNHEYLADAGALQRTADPSVYRAALLNQIAGETIFSLSNSFSYSLTKKRFTMMKEIISSPYRKIKLLLILPVVAGILYAFAKPEYKLPDNDFTAGNETPAVLVQEKVVKGVVLQQDGKPLPGAAIIVKGTTIGTISDQQGSFALNNIPYGAPLVISYVGYTGKVVKPDYSTEMKITMVRDTISVGSIQTAPPPPLPPFKIRSDEGKSPLIVVDGKIIDIDLEKIDPNTIESVSVLKDESATIAYGDKGKDGVVMITTKKGAASAGNSNKDQKEIEVVGYGTKEVFTVVEEMPRFPGGEAALMKWIASNVKYPAEAVKKGITGLVIVTYEVTETGAVKNAKVEKPVDLLLDAEAVRVVSSMPAWMPGKQNGKPVSVIMKIPVDFKLK